MIKFDMGSKEGFKKVMDIVDRAASIRPDIDKMSLGMDITATHLNGCPLDLDKFIGFDDFSFMHDINGIMRYIDRNTGQLTDCFLPRCSAKED